MLSKNQWIAITVITLANSVFVGCNNGGGSNAPTSVIDCRLPQNFSNLTCINARPGMTNRPYGSVGAGRPLSVGSFSRRPPEWGLVPLTVTNPSVLMGLCFQARNQTGNPVRRSVYDGRGADYIDGDDRYDGIANVNDGGYNGLCMSPFTTVVTFEIKQAQNRNGGRQDAYVALWKFYFIPGTVPVNANTDADQLRYMGPSTGVMQGYLTSGPNGGFQANFKGIIFAGTDNGNTLGVSILTRAGVVGNGTMTLAPF